MARFREQHMKYKYTVFGSPTVQVVRLADGAKWIMDSGILYISYVYCIFSMLFCSE